MMNAHLPAEPLRSLDPPVESPFDVLKALIARHGLLRVVLALGAALRAQRRDRARSGHGLSPHLQRDIGLTLDRSPYWDMR